MNQFGCVAAYLSSSYWCVCSAAQCRVRLCVQCTVQSETVCAVQSETVCVVYRAE